MTWGKVPPHLLIPTSIGPCEAPLARGARARHRRDRHTRTTPHKHQPAQAARQFPPEPAVLRRLRHAGQHAPREPGRLPVHPCGRGTHGAGSNGVLRVLGTEKRRPLLRTIRPVAIHRYGRRQALGPDHRLDQPARHQPQPGRPRTRRHSARTRTFACPARLTLQGPVANAPRDRYQAPGKAGRTGKREKRACC